MKKRLKNRFSMISGLSKMSVCVCDTDTSWWTQKMMEEYASGRNHRRFSFSLFLQCTFIHHYYNGGEKNNSFNVKTFQSCFIHMETKAPGRKSGFLIWFPPHTTLMSRLFGMKSHTFSPVFLQVNHLLNGLLSTDRYTQIKSCFPSKISLLPQWISLLNIPLPDTANTQLTVSTQGTFGQA